MEIPEMFLYQDYGDKYSIFTTISVINYMNFKKFLMGELYLFKTDLQAYQDELYHTIKQKWSNSNFRFSNIYGDEFAFALYNNMLSVWNSDGGTALGTFELSDDLTQRQKTINEVLKISEKWTIGEVQCSDCKSWINYQENNQHRYFAGIYCLDCWERKWKAIEAKETYN